MGFFRQKVSLPCIVLDIVGNQTSTNLLSKQIRNTSKIRQQNLLAGQ
jgi:hypothetical protein